MASLYQRLKHSKNPNAAMEVICNLMEKGKTTTEIAHIMGVSERWIRTLAKRKNGGLPSGKLLSKKSTFQKRK